MITGFLSLLFVLVVFPVLLWRHGWKEGINQAIRLIVLLIPILVRPVAVAFMILVMHAVCH